jgi:hypothetical protein
VPACRSGPAHSRASSISCFLVLMYSRACLHLPSHAVATFSVQVVSSRAMRNCCGGTAKLVATVQTVPNTLLVSTSCMFMYCCRQKFKRLIYGKQ